MREMRPLIGLTVNEMSRNGNPGIFLGKDYTDGVLAAGGLPVVLPFSTNQNEIRDWADRLDGLLLTGGEDIAPALYGEEPRQGLGEISPVRDYFEAKLLVYMIEQNKPVFAICRGIQVLNAVMGGTLFQDLPREWPSSLQHSQKAPRDHSAHVVKISKGTKLNQIVGPDDLQTNTFHHQAVKQIAPGLAPSAHSRDGLIEAIEDPLRTFVIGVQWHPENLWQLSDRHFKLFTAFVEAAKSGQKTL